MSHPSEREANGLLAGLPASDYHRFIAGSRAVDLGLGESLAERGQPFHDVYFPDHGFVSVTRSVDQRPGLEVRLVGNEGMIGATLALEAEESTNQATVFGVGSARAMDPEAFREQLAGSEPLARIVRRYLQVMMGQLGQSAACMRFHRATPRLARWLLNAHDRVAGDLIEITHEQLAGLLGIRRVGVTGAASGLQRQKMIRYQRGRLTILDRKRLETLACPCYADDCALYSRVMRLDGNAPAPAVATDENVS